MSVWIAQVNIQKEIDEARATAHAPSAAVVAPPIAIDPRIAKRAEYAALKRSNPAAAALAAMDLLDDAVVFGEGR